MRGLPRRGARDIHACLLAGFFTTSPVRPPPRHAWARLSVDVLCEHGELLLAAAQAAGGGRALKTTERSERAAAAGCCAFTRRRWHTRAAHATARAGTFGRVLECWDRKTRDYVAIKIVRNVQKYRDAAMIEVRAPRRRRAAVTRAERVDPVERAVWARASGSTPRTRQKHLSGDIHTRRMHAHARTRTPQLEVLNTLERNDPRNAWHCVHLREWFDYRGHVCMAFEKLGPSLYDYLRRTGYRPFPAYLVRVCVCGAGRGVRAHAPMRVCVCVSAFL